LKMEDDLETCPYNKAHRIKKSRFAVHLDRCRRNDDTGMFTICNYNSSHHVKKGDMVEHLRTCQDKIKVEARNLERELKAANTNNKIVEIEAVVHAPPIQYDDDEEDWDNLQATTYKPQAAIANRKVMRNIQNATPLQRKEFRKQEFERFQKFEGNESVLKEQAACRRDEDDDSIVTSDTRSSYVSSATNMALEEFYKKLNL